MKEILRICTYCKSRNICGTLIFVEFALRSASAYFRTRKNISMTSYACFERAELCASKFKNQRIYFGVAQCEKLLAFTV